MWFHNWPQKAKCIKEYTGSLLLFPKELLTHLDLMSNTSLHWFIKAHKHCTTNERNDVALCSNFLYLAYLPPGNTENKTDNVSVEYTK